MWKNFFITFGPWAETIWQACQNCILCIYIKTFWRKTKFPKRMSFSTILRQWAEKFKIFVDLFRGCVRNAFYVSIRLLQRIKSFSERTSVHHCRSVNKKIRYLFEKNQRDCPKRKSRWQRKRFRRSLFIKDLVLIFLGKWAKKVWLLWGKSLQDCQNWVLSLERNFQEKFFLAKIIFQIFFEYRAEKLRLTVNKNLRGFQTAVCLSKRTNWTKVFSEKFSSFVDNFLNHFRSLIKKNWRACQNCILRVQRSILKKIEVSKTIKSFHHCWTVSRVLSAFYRCFWRGW